MKHILLTVLLFAPFVSHAKLQGQARLDSLLAELPKMKEDSTGVSLLRLISSTYTGIDPQQGVVYGERAVALGKRIGNKRYTAQAYNDLGNNLSRMADYPAAYANYLEALKLHEAAGSKGPAAGTMLNIGIVFVRQGERLKARDYYLKAEQLALELDNKPILLALYENLSGTYEPEDTTHAALNYLTKALTVAEALKDSVAIGHVLGNMGSVYVDMHRLEEAIRYQRMSLAISKAKGLDRSTAYNLSSMGTSYLAMAQDSTGPLSGVSAKERMHNAAQLP